MAEKTETTILDEGAVSEIGNRANAASRGPWSQSALAGAYIVGRHTDDFPVICALAEYEKDGTLYLEFANAKNNMAFLAHAREDIPALCATVKHLREELADVREELRVADDALENQSQWMSECRAQRESLQSQLEQLRTQLAQVEQERDRILQLYNSAWLWVQQRVKHPNSGLPPAAMTLMEMLPLLNQRAIQLCKSKAAGYRQGAEGNLAYETWIDRAEVAEDLVFELEKL